MKHLEIILARISGVFVSHSHIVQTCQPSFPSSFKENSSLALFLRNFSCQNSLRVSGIVALLQPGCWCQKHPCTNIQRRYLGRTISGLPGRSLRCNLNRKPIEWSVRLTRISGEVSLALTAAMFFERCSLLSRSIMVGMALNNVLEIKPNSRKS